MGGGLQVYLLRPHHVSRRLQWLQWWLRGEEGSRLLLIKPCKCKNAAPAKRQFSLGQMKYTCSVAMEPNSEERHALILRE